MQINQGNRARTYAERASQIASNNKDRSDASGLLQFIDHESPVEVASR
jgi:hypothetical protein